ncbi:MAG: C69 family dipeptidase, partial [Chloroflexi bacterium]|nr:C69 family dipeptidase [Chloroflexota bacterium]
MCDTLVALGNATRDGSVIFAKSSDREPNEAHLLEWHPRAQHPAGSTVRCTYIEIPQVEETYEILLCKPFWLWGCEMGANEKGVVIGNEAVFTREPYAPTGLLGMDLMRLALERAATADEALRVITELIAQYGQGGACGYRNKRLRYHNSFIIADAQSAWVLETAGRYWAAERVRDVRTISNRLTIGREYDLASPGLVEHALERGWCRSREEFHFARCYSDWFYSTFSRARERQADSTAYLEAYRGRIGVETMMAALRRHARGSSDHPYDPA